MRNRELLVVVGGVVVFAACARGGTFVAAQKPRPPRAPEPVALPLVPASGGAGSTLALVRQGDRQMALVADADARVVRWLDTHTQRELGSTRLDGEPSQLVVAGDGRVFVGLRDRAEVDVLELVSDAGQPPDATRDPVLRVAARMATAEEPAGLSLTPDSRTLLVACGWGHALDVFATRTLERRFRVDLAREPRAVVTSEDGALAYVSHAAASLVSVIDLQTPEHEVEAVRLDRSDPLHDGQRLQWRQGYALARTEFGVLAPGVTASTGDTTVRSETYGGVDASSMPSENFALNVVHPHAPEGLGDGSVPARAMDMPAGCLLPRAAAYDPTGQSLLVACQGLDQVWSLNMRPTGGGARQAVWLVGSEPTGLAVDVDGRTLFVWSQATHTVASMDLDAAHPSAISDEEGDAVQHIVLGSDPEVAPAVALGREIFHRTGDAQISSDGRACASCHPDGRDDGLVWATPDGPRQTPTLAGRLEGTAPYGWNGARATVKAHVTGTVVRLGGSGLDDASMDALVAYCMHMDGPPRVAAAAAPLDWQSEASLPQADAEDPLVAQGRDVFESSSTGCASCHMSDGTFTDGNRHDVKSKTANDPHRRFDTPSLRFVSGTAPYFHDGRYPTLRALLVGSDGKMGHTAGLSPHELDALEAYLKTL